MTTYKKTDSFNYRLHTSGFINVSGITHSVVDGTFYPLETVDLSEFDSSSIDVVLAPLTGTQIETADITDGFNTGSAAGFWELANGVLSIGYIYSGISLTPTTAFGIKVNYFVFIH